VGLENCVARGLLPTGDFPLRVLRLKFMLSPEAKLAMSAKGSEDALGGWVGERSVLATAGLLTKAGKEPTKGGSSGPPDLFMLGA